jgi:hypothetical protein
MIGQDQMPEDLKRTLEIERLKSGKSGDKTAQIGERPEKTKEVEEGKKKLPGAL